MRARARCFPPFLRSLGELAGSLRGARHSAGCARRVQVSGSRETPRASLSSHFSPRGSTFPADAMEPAEGGLARGQSRWTSAAAAVTLLALVASSCRAEDASCHGAYDLYFVLDK